MTSKETLFFIGKCLTINHEEHNKVLVESALKADEVNWDDVVKISTAHYVFPALYCNLKKAGFLHYLPDDLVEYMQHITDLNRERNEQIITQAREINDLLLANAITPIFLKGTGNLLEGLYDDIAERMVGDIDFLVSKEEYQETITITEKSGYDKVHDNRELNFPSHRHYFRLKKENRIAAVEIHKGLTNEKFDSKFNFEKTTTDLLTINNIHLLNYKNQLSLSIIAKQINDDGQYFNNIALRNAYDIFLLSKKTNSLNAIKPFDTLFKPLNNFLAIVQSVLNSKTVLFESNSNSEKTLKKFNTIITEQKKQQAISLKLFIKKRLHIIYKSIFNKEYRNWLLKKLFSKEW